MVPHRLKLEQARQIAVRAAMLDAAGAPDLLSMVRGLGMLRVELTGIVMPAADHIGFTRLGPSYRASHTEHALATGILFERNWMLRPMDALGLYLASMRDWLDRAGARIWVEANAPFRQGIIDRIADLGPLTSLEIPDEAIVPMTSSGWRDNRNVTTMLDCMEGAGDLAVVGRNGRLRIWDLAENVFPPTEEVPPAEAHLIRSERLLAAFGVWRDVTAISPTEIHNVDRVGEEAVIDGVPGKWRVDPAQLDSGLREFGGRTAILSPFDRLISDRTRVAKLFDFDYTLEMFKPVSTRKWGAFALPILHGERLIGKVDARSDTKTGRFVVNAVHEDVRFTKAMRSAVDDELEQLTDWMRLELVRT